jgi:hypothetical protein
MGKRGRVIMTKWEEYKAQMADLGKDGYYKKPNIVVNPVGKELAPGIWVYKNVFENTKDLVSSIESLFGHSFSDAEVYEGKDNGGVNKKSRDCSVLAFPSFIVSSYTKDKKDLYYLIEDSMTACLDHYKGVYGLGNDLTGDSWQVLKYGSGGKFTSHSDDGARYPRTVSITAYLNEEYTGGDLEYKYFGLKIKPEPGDVLVFPSNYVYNHEVHPVESGIRYAIVNWFRWNTLPVQLKEKE